MVDSCAATVIARPMAPLANDRAPYPLVCAGLKNTLLPFYLKHLNPAGIGGVGWDSGGVD